ncbi:MAG TPA: GAF domain-containing protein [Rhizomicrobium sp.]
MTSALLEAERNILARIATGGPLEEVLRDIVLLVEKPSNGEMLASILFLSDDGKHLREAAAPSLPDEYNAAIDGIAIGMGVGSCGTAAFTGQPVFVSDIANDPLWKDFRDLALQHGLRACWSVPIRGADGRVLGTFANYYREPKEPTERDTEVISMVAQTTAIAIERHRRELDRQRSEEKHMLLVRELNHRVKNIFALANSLVVMSARSANSADELSKAVQGRLSALSRAHELVQPGFNGDQMQSSDVPLRTMFADILAPYRISHVEDRVTMTGEDIGIAPDAVTSLALVLHELATNAAKYGALCGEHGTIDLSWTLTETTLDIAWIERGGPPVSAPPERSGFGTTLARRSVEGQLGGKIAHEWAPEGLRVAICLPRATLLRE